LTGILLEQGLGLLTNYYGNMKLVIKKSNIQGVGVFTEENIPFGKVIGIVIENDFRITPFGSKLNHSWSPNVVLKEHNGKYYAVTLTNISSGTEITVDYRQTPNFIKKPLSHWK